MKNMKMQPQVIKPFSTEVFKEIQTHIKHVRKMFDHPGMIYHDANEPEQNRFNRWMWHNLPLLKQLHHDPEFIAKVFKVTGKKLKPSYVFLSMYGPEGVCPYHVDRPQCRITVDLCIDQDAVWPIYVDDVAYNLKPGEALVYSGTDQPHYRKPMKDDSQATWCNLAFFHFVPTDWMGETK